MRIAANKVRVKVPATSANLGPGFDSLGVALALYDEIEIKALASTEVNITVTGEGKDTVPYNERHLVVKALRFALEYVGAPLIGVNIQCLNRIPHKRGLGSSAAAAVAGLVAARGFISEPEALDDNAILALATELEGHPDNAAPAILGGATASWIDANEGPRAVNLAVDAAITATVFVPNTQLATKVARGALPSTVPHRDASFNAARAALLIHALASDPGLLKVATEDRLHQQYRSAVMPDSWQLLSHLRELGFAATVSGAGPTVLVLHQESESAELDSAIAGNKLLGVSGKWQQLRIPISETGCELAVVD